MSVEKRILEIMENSGLTPSEFADKIEVQRSAISHITSGRNKPSLEFLLKIKKAFPEIDTEWLFLGEEKISQNPDTDKPLASPTPTLFDEFTKEDVSNSSQKKVKRIILFFEDGSFEDFLRDEIF